MQRIERLEAVRHLRPYTHRQIAHLFPGRTRRQRFKNAGSWLARQQRAGIVARGRDGRLDVVGVQLR